MAYDSKHGSINKKIDEGYIKSFKDIFLFTPKTTMANALGKNVTRFNKTLSNVEKFTFKDAYEIAEKFRIPKKKVFDLIDAEYEIQLKERKADQS
jgi:hypothetical protein